MATLAVWETWAEREGGLHSSCGPGERAENLDVRRAEGRKCLSERAESRENIERRAESPWLLQTSLIPTQPISTYDSLFLSPRTLNALLNIEQIRLKYKLHDNPVLHVISNFVKL